MSSSQKVLGPFNAIEAIAFSADRTSSAFDVSFADEMSIQAVWTGGSTPVGTLKVQFSNDGSTYVESATTASISGTTGSVFISLSNMSFKYAKVFLDWTSGNATISAWVLAKGK
jgi:hypothetical protein